MRSKAQINSIVLSLLVALPLMSTDIFLAALPAIRDYFGGSQEETKKTLTYFMAGFGISTLLFGVISDRYGRRPIVLFCLALFSISSLIAFFSSTLDTLVWSRFFQALGAGSGTVLARSIIRDLYKPNEAVEVLAMIAAVMTFSTLLAPILGSMLYESMGWRSSFGFMSLIGIITLLSVLVHLPESIDRLDKNALKFRELKRKFLSCVGKNEFVGLTLTISFIWSSFFIFIMQSSFLLQEKLGLSILTFGVVYALIVAGYILGTIIARKLAVGYSPLIVIKWGLFVSVSSLFMMVFAWEVSPGAVSISVCMFVFLVGCGLIVPICQAAALEPFPEMAGFAGSLFYSVEMSVSAIVALFVAGLALETHLILFAMALFAALGLGSFFYWCNLLPSLNER